MSRTQTTRLEGLHAGFALCGFGLGESAEARSQLLDAAIEHLPEDLPRIMSGAFSPAEVLQAVACGVDIFDTSYAVKAASSGQALSLFADPGISAAAAEAALSAAAASRSKQSSAEPPPGGRPPKRVLHGVSGKAKAQRMAAPAAAHEHQDLADTIQGASLSHADAAAADGMAADGGPDATAASHNADAPPRAAGLTGSDAVFATAAASAAPDSEQSGASSILQPPKDSKAGSPAFGPGHMNLWSLAYQLDKRPFVEGCTCMACRMHTRAYVHHLLNTEEMLAKVLLEVHNTHEYMQLFVSIRTAISEQRLALLQQKIISKQLCIDHDQSSHQSQN